MANTFYLLLLLLFSSSSFALLDLNMSRQKSLTPAATTLHQAVSELPELHFLDQQQQKAVDNLLVRVLDEQAKQINYFKTELIAYKASPDSAQAWKNAQRGYYSTLSLSHDKQKLLSLSSPPIRDLVTGFGPEGVRQFKSELYLTRLNVEFYLHQEIRAFKRFVEDIFISPIPVLVVIFKVFMLQVIMFWWLRNSNRFITLLRDKISKNGRSTNLWLHLLWYVARAHRAIAWLISITLSLRIIAQLPSLQHLVFLEIFTWWILGGAIAVSFILEFAYQHSRRLSKAIITLRLSTIRLYVWGFISTGLISQISEMTLGKGTIYAWISSLIFFFYLLLTLYSLHKWKAFIFERLATKKEQPALVKWANDNKQRWIFASLSTAIAASWLILRTLQHYLIDLLSHSQLFSHALAYLFRIEVAKQSENESEQLHLEAIRGEETFSYVRPGSADSLLIPEYAQQSYDALATYLLSDKPAVCVLSGERGVGTTTLLRRFLHDVDDAQAIYVSCPHEGFDALMALICEQLGLPDSGEALLLTHLRSTSKCYLFAFDNVQRLVKPQVGGLAPLMRLTNLLRQSKNSHRALLAIEKSSWRFVDRARGERLLFDLVEFLPRWKESEISQLLASRITDNGQYALSFDGLALPRQWEKDELSEDQRACHGFYRILWDYSDGNPTVALRFFRRSLFKNSETNTVQVRLFQIPSSEGLEKMPKPMLAVLRSIVQLEVASPEELTDCTRLSINEVISTLRYFQSRGYIEWSGEKLRVSDLWFRNITNILHRQHLLVK
ncbi:AAA family ATPase [Psychromonas sp. psych-6C06]|uniref:ATP-binding protein n=1 Tax=Psychromonas sp. psych-6C06 TaxID=2058089 RepID=UPI000C3469C5|nr:ATP-binding protein [Psychromonas sp. psych-6C06]PKF63122.1 AAA family ATPase [Psychromonas sp. psych-6C06]